MSPNNSKMDMFFITKLYWMNLVSNGFNMSGLVYEFVNKCELRMMIECAKLDGFNDWPMFATLTTCDAPPSSLMDSTMSPKVKTSEGGIRSHSLACSVSGVKGHVGAPGWN